MNNTIWSTQADGGFNMGKSWATEFTIRVNENKPKIKELKEKSFYKSKGLIL